MQDAAITVLDFPRGPAHLTVNTRLPTAKSLALSPKPCCGTAEGQGRRWEFLKNGI